MARLFSKGKGTGTDTAAIIAAGDAETPAGADGPAGAAGVPDHLAKLQKEMDEVEKESLGEAKKATEAELIAMDLLDGSAKPPEPPGEPPLPPPVAPPISAKAEPPPPPPPIRAKAMPRPPPQKAEPKAPWQTQDKDKSWQGWWHASHEETAWGKRTSWHASSSWKEAPAEDAKPDMCFDSNL